MANEYGIGYWGQNAWNENSDVNITVTGQQLNSNTGTLSATGEINTGWGRLTWGEQDWGTTGISIITTPTGIGLSTTLGTLTLDANTIASPTGIQLNVAEGNVDPAPDAL